MKIIFWLSLRPKIKLDGKKKWWKQGQNNVFFSSFFVKNFQTRSPAGLKNDFRAKILLESCSVTSNYPWNALSFHQEAYYGLPTMKLKKIEQICANSALFGGGYCKSSMGKSIHKCPCMHTKNFKNPKNSNYLRDRVSGRKTFLGAN